MQEKQYYAQYDLQGNIIGFYVDDIHDNIPDNTIKITEHQWQDCLQNPGKWVVANGSLQLAPEPDPVLVIRQAKDARSAFLNNQYQEILSSPVTFINENSVSALYDSSVLSVNKIENVISQGEPYAQNLWNDSGLNIISPFSFDDLNYLLEAINNKINSNPVYADLLDKLRLVENATTIQEINSISF